MLIPNNLSELSFVQLFLFYCPNSRSRVINTPSAQKIIITSGLHRISLLIIDTGNQYIEFITIAYPFSNYSITDDLPKKQFE